jgi:hypothetical protein
MCAPQVTAAQEVVSHSEWETTSCALFTAPLYQQLELLPLCLSMTIPLLMEGVSDNEGTDNEYEWPSAALDHGQAMQVAIEHHKERQRCVEEWVTAV